MEMYLVSEFELRGRTMLNGEVAYVVRDRNSVLYVGQTRYGIKARIRGHVLSQTKLGKTIEEGRPASGEWLVDVYTLAELQSELANMTQSANPDSTPVDVAFEKSSAEHIAWHSIASTYTLLDVEQFLIAKFNPRLNEVKYMSRAVLNHFTQSRLCAI